MNENGIRVELRTKDEVVLLTRDFEREMVRRLRDAGADDDELARFQETAHGLVVELEDYARTLPKQPKP